MRESRTRGDFLIEKKGNKQTFQQQLSITELQAAILYYGLQTLEALPDTITSKLGNARAENPIPMEGEEAVKKLDKELFLEALNGSSVGAVIEDVIFRYIPNKVAMKKGTERGNWIVGLISSAAFAASHNFYKDEKTQSWKFSRKMIPLQQFVAGVALWNQMRERGFYHAMHAHIIQNTNITATILPWYLKHRKDMK